MNSTSIELEPVPKLRGTISDEDFWNILYFCVYFSLFVCIVGSITNLINIRTFLSMGLKDGVTITLLGLALSDFGFTFCGVIQNPAGIISLYESKSSSLPVQPLAIGMWAANISLIFYPVTCMTTTFISIARCMCVAMPFRFKDFFTTTKSAIAVVIFNIVAIIYYTPVLFQMGFRKDYDYAVNRTRWVLWLSDKRSDYKDVVTFINFVLFIGASCTVVTFCICVMARSLRESTKFRNLSTAGGDAEKSDTRLSGKELQVVKQVIILCIIYTVTLTPTMFMALYRLVEPEYELGARYGNSYVVSSQISGIVTQINSSTTFPIYLAYNTKFRTHLTSCWRKQDKSKSSSASEKS